uniref:Vascular cell adhesion molecule 1a n=1 Tax=Cyprinus carpio carpio TaxID=630221 RepID=A0A9J7ZDT5_CYPCA
MCGVKCISFVLWIDILNAITGENIPKLEITPLNSVIHVGEDLKITCKVIDCPVNATFVWTSAMDKFLKAEIKNEHNVSHLLMRNISIHSDSVKCQTTCDRKILQKMSVIEVFYGPGTVTVSSNNTSVKLGEQLEITCHADGNPKPKIFWWKLGETEPEHQSQNNKLIISNASWSQAGWYRCNASNNVGSQQMSVKVIVVGPPNIPKIQLSHRGELKEGENISIFCSSDGGPAELKLYRQSQSAATGGPNESAVLLNISSIQITDAGIYICEAKNDFGIETSKMNITVKAQHSFSRNPDLPVAILPAVGSVSLLTAAGLLIRHCRKQARSNLSTLI